MKKIISVTGKNGTFEGTIVITFNVALNYFTGPDSPTVIYTPIHLVKSTIVGDKVGEIPEERASAGELLDICHKAEYLLRLRLQELSEGPEETKLILDLKEQGFQFPDVPPATISPESISSMMNVYNSLSKGIPPESNDLSSETKNDGDDL